MHQLRSDLQVPDINVRQGGCNPAPLDRALVDGQVVLKAADLERGAFYF